MVRTVHLEGPKGAPKGAGVGVVDEFVGSAQVFALALEEVFNRTLLKEVAGGSIGPAQMRILKLVAQSKAETISDVAAFQGVSTAAASKAIDRLVRSDLLKRTEGAADRRESELRLTRTGEQLLDAYESGRTRGLEGIFKGFSVVELESATDLIDRLTASIVGHSSQPGVCLQCHVFRREKCFMRNSSSGECFYQRRKRRKDAGRIPQVEAD